LVVLFFEALSILSVKGIFGDRPALIHNTFWRYDVANLEMQASSSNGRASDSKSGGWGFKSLLACHFFHSALGF
jgi:hypothetical protein